MRISVVQTISPVQIIYSTNKEKMETSTVKTWGTPEEIAMEETDDAFFVVGELPDPEELPQVKTPFSRGSQVKEPLKVQGPITFLPPPRLSNLKRGGKEERCPGPFGG